tara:strand:- start:132 stop:440 length:309 start_codon:yes stop_codon:yes gene_type:complete
MTTKIIYNNSYGGFGLSDLAKAALLRAGCTEEEVYNFLYESRHDPRLVHVVETMGPDLVSGPCSRLCVATIPGTKYWVTEYDGMESIDTPDTVKWIDATQTS